MNNVSQVYTDDQQEPCAGTQSNHSIIYVSITYHRVSFQINPEMVSHGNQQVFCYCPGCLLEVRGLHKTSAKLTPEKNICIC